MLNKKSLFKKAILLAATLAAVSAPAASFNYNSRDLLVCFRNGGTYDFIVDAGPVNAFITASTTITISGTYYSVNAMNYAFSPNGVSSTTRDGVYFSVFANDQSTNILWATHARSNPGSQSSAWAAQSYLAQGNTASKMENVGNSASDYSSVHVNPATNNTATALVESSSYTGGGDKSYTGSIGSGNFNTFVGNVENLTPSGFSTGSTAAVSDLYQIIPTTDINGNPMPHQGTTWLGYFTFNPSGTLTFTPASLASPSLPVILSFKRTGTTNKVTFTTGATGTYYLCGTNNLTASHANWPVITSSPGINGTTNLVEVTTNALKYYFIKAQ